MGLGSNRAWNSLDSFAILEEAFLSLAALLKEMRCASFYKTEPIPASDQCNFLNTAVSGFFSGSPHELLEAIHGIEARFGRDRAKEKRWGERSLDIDILLFGALKVNSPDLVVPHPRLVERRFALEPMLELFPEARSPETGALYQDICGALPDQGVELAGKAGRFK